MTGGGRVNVGKIWTVVGHAFPQENVDFCVHFRQSTGKSGVDDARDNGIRCRLEETTADRVVVPAHIQNRSEDPE